MKRVIFLTFSVFLFACSNKKAIDRDREMLPGKWFITWAQFNPDSRDVFKNANARKGWQIEFTKEGTFQLQEGDSSYSGTYFNSLFQLKLNCMDSTGKISKQILWYNFSVSRRRLECTVMEKEGFYEYVWKKE